MRLLHTTIQPYRRMLRRVKKRYALLDGSALPLQRITAALDSKGCTALLRSRQSSLLSLLQDLFGAYGSSLTPELLRQSVLRQGRKSKTAFRDAELFALPELLAVCCLHQLDTAEDNERETVLHMVAELLRSCEEGGKLRLRELYRTLSTTDGILRRYDPLCYSRCDEATRHQIRQEVYRLAKQKRIPEPDGALLYCRGSRPRYFPGWGYFALWGGLFALLVFGGCLLLGLPGLWLLLPFSELSKGLCDRLLSGKLPPRPIPRLEPGPIPPDAKTAVVITTLLTGKDDPLFRRLETMWRQTRDEQVQFGLLCDLRESDDYTDPKDEAILQNAAAKLQALRERCGDHFFLLFRTRVKQPGEKRYRGWERKRGALLELCRFADGEESSLQLLGGAERFLRDCRYIVTLDADTELRIGAVRELVFTMLHPACRPVVKNGIVVSGHGLLQPGITTSLAAACASPFTVMLNGSGGSDPYQSTASDLTQTLFGKGLYCGKGIFDRSVYREVLEHAFPENRILSHDLLEGTRLRAGAMPELQLFDGCPRSTSAYFRRLHRWLRGDFQALPFALPRVKNANGKTVPNPIGGLERFWIFDNCRRALTPLAACAAIARSLFLPKKPASALLLLSLAFLLLPVIRALLRCRSKLFRRFYSNVLEGGWHALCEAIFRTVTLFHTGWITADAALRAFWRTTISHRNCLEWVTAADSEKDAGFPALYRSFFPSVVAGLLLLTLVPYPLHKLLGLGFFLCPFLAWMLSVPYPEERDPGTKRKALLTEWSRDAFRFFEDTVGEEDHFLPPDNLQLLPVEAIAHRTSPTNIAMYLLALLAAADFGFLTPTELCDRLERTVRTVEALPKYKGLLYNWYDTETLEVLGSPYLSSVDCGNYLCALVTLREGLQDYRRAEQPDLSRRLESLQERLRALEDASELQLLYNTRKDLFCIGYDPLQQKQSENCYDLLMSESRLTGYYAIARGIVPQKHWGRLGRPLIGRSGHIGLRSWSGTAFEYFLPALLLRSFPGALSYEALGFALFEQIADPAPRGDFWGRSESGYFAFDGDMNYQYRAFGCDRLAMDTPKKQQVFAPYGVFLALCCSFSLPIRALQKMKQMGLYGKYGFFEAVDMTPDRVGAGHAVIRSYMAHHTGMLLCAAANACFENRMQQRFLRDGDMAAATELLCERIPVDASVPSYKRQLQKGSHPKLLRMPVALLEKGDPDKDPAEVPAECALLSGGGLQLYADADGNLLLRGEKEAITYPRLRDPDSRLRSLRIFFSDGKRCFDPTAGKGTRIENRGNRLRYRRDLPEEKLSLTLDFTLAGDAPFLAIQLTAEGEFTLARSLVGFEVLLCPEKDFFAHPDYHRLGVTSEYRASDRLLLFRRLIKDPHRSTGTPVLLMTAIGGGKQEVLTRADALLPRNYREEDLRALCTLPFPPLSGEALQRPYCALRKTASCRSGRYRETFLLGFGEDAEALCDKALLLRREGNRLSQRFGEQMQQNAVQQLRSAGILPRQQRFEGLLLTRLLQAPSARDDCAPIDALWRYGISGDLPIVCLHCERDAPTATGRAILGGFLRAHRLLRIKGFRCDMVLLYRASEVYTDAGRQSLSLLIRNHTAPGALNRPGGVHLLPEEAAPVLRACATLYGSIGEDSLPETVFIKPPLQEVNRWAKPAAIPFPLPSEPPLPGGEAIADFPGGQLVEDGFAVSRPTALKGRPYSRVYTNAAFGTLCNHRSLGYSWFVNAALFPLTARPSSDIAAAAGERMLLETADHCYDLAACAGGCFLGRESICWQGLLPEGIAYRMVAGIGGKYPLKYVRVELRNPSDSPKTVALRYAVRPDLRSPACTETVHHQTRFYRGCRTDGRFGMFLLSPAAAEHLTLAPGGQAELCFLLGAMHFSSDRAYYAMRERFAKTLPTEDAAAYRSIGEFRTRFTLQSGDPAMDALFNRELPTQLLRARIYGRCGPDQCGGAWGFRDQLQDCMNLLEWQPSLLKIQLLRCAARQYYEGDVQHWWHKDLCAGLPPTDTQTLKQKTGAGLRSRCGDDLLWLPFAIARYLEVTGDTALLQARIPYLESTPLAPGETERYEMALPTARKESLYTHGMRAIEAALHRMGENGLPLFGSGDWNDGMDRVGKDGKGESVWLGEFLLLTLRCYLPVAERFGTDADRKILTAAMEALEARLPAWYAGDRYARGSFDSGRRFGVAGCGECEIDLLPQAFAAILGLPHAKTAMDSALRELWDKERGMLRLLAPPFQGKLPMGSIAAYAPGLRENGGQYTHGALFGVWGLLALGDCETAFEIFHALLPISQAKHPDYGGEPYAIAADIAGTDGIYGAVGWTHYTGAAGWALQLLLRGFLGYRETPDGFTLSPRLCPAFPGFSLRVQRGPSDYRITVRQDKAPAVLLDGSPAKNAVFPFDSRSHRLDLRLSSF